ncbi:MAG: hypothetical protein PHE59_03145 [Patescibacteria group bacterium]|nr:hypothetical protein [Patescibacteria group bacterium]MDD5164612.1 hypothetical protein [Patescibacteria group bacterium]MDD5534546.1 hypothetical protein [Patescibacteria group bacterium]
MKGNNQIDFNVIEKEMDELWEMYKRCKSHHSYREDNVIGLKCIEPGEYYSNRNKFSICYDNPITQEDKKENNKISNWINENFIVRLCSILDCYQICSNRQKIDHKINNWQDINFIRQLRNIFCHTTESNFDKKYQKIIKKIGEYLKLSKNDFGLSIDKVIEPLFNGCKEYIKILKNQKLSFPSPFFNFILKIKYLWQKFLDKKVNI